MSHVTQKPARGSLWVAGHSEEVNRSDGAATLLLDLGAPVRIVDLWGEILDEGPTLEDSEPARVLVIEVLNRPDWLSRSLKALRNITTLQSAPVLAVIGERSIAELAPASGHDDFVVWPAPPSELYARIRMLEWKSSAYASEDVIKLGPLEVDLAAHTVSLHGAGDFQQVSLTSREYALLLALLSRRGRVLTRETLLDAAWGDAYEGGAKTVDVHVRRLRAKLGDALPLETVRGAGYVLR